MKQNDSWFRGKSIKSKEMWDVLGLNNYIL